MSTVDVRQFLRRTVEPSALPVTMAQVCRVLDLGDDTETKQEVTDIIRDATDTVERDSRRALMPQTWQLTLDRFHWEIELHRPPIRVPDEGDTVVVQYVLNGATLTLDAESYQLDTTTEPARIRPVVGTCWPLTDCVVNAVTVTFLAGYPDRESIPAVAQRAIMLACKALYHGCELGEAYWSFINRLRWEGGV